MCLALPARVIELGAHDLATVDMGGVRKQISLALLDGVQIDDYVIVHAGYALTLLNQAEALQTLALFEQMKLDQAASGSTP